MWKTWENPRWLCKHEFPGGFCDKTLDTFQKLKKYGINAKGHNKFFDHFIVYDFETILSKTEIKKTDHLNYTNKHNPFLFLFSQILKVLMLNLFM